MVRSMAAQARAFRKVPDKAAIRAAVPPASPDCAPARSRLEARDAWEGTRDAAQALRLDDGKGRAPPRGVVAGAVQLRRGELLSDPAAPAAWPHVPRRAEEGDPLRR